MTTISQNNINTPVATIFGDWREKFGELWTKQVAALKEKFSSDIEEVRMPGDFPTDVPIIYVRKEALTSILKFAKDPTTDFWRTLPRRMKAESFALRSSTT